MAKEIERKYLIDPSIVLPPADREFNITQVYLMVTPDIEVRVREKNYSYYCTVKVGNGLVREEYEVGINILEFNRLGTGKPYLTKVRRRYGAWEVDVYEKPHTGLIIAEIELLEASAEVEIPLFLKPYIIREVTGESQYANKNLCTLDFQPPLY